MIHSYLINKLVKCDWNSFIVYRETASHENVYCRFSTHPRFRNCKLRLRRRERR